MTLRKTTLRIIALTSIGLVLALYVTAQVIVLGGFAQQEQQESQQNVERVQSALEDNLSTLQGTTRDWAMWDDTYEFIQDRSDEYYRSNLINDTPLISNKLNLMAFVDLSGQIVFSKTYDLASAASAPFPKGLLDHFSANDLLLHHPGPDTGTKGLLSLPEGPMLVAAEPIVTSENKGPVRGTLVFGRYLDTQAIQHLSKTTLFALRVYRVGDASMPADFQSALAAMSAGSPAVVQPLTSESIAGYGMLRDIYGKPGLVFRADMPRTMYVQGQVTALYFMVVLIIASVTFGGITLLLLEKGVLSRLARLSAGVSAIGASGDVSARVSVSGPRRSANDELSSLSNDINTMLDALEQSQQKRLESKKRFRAIFENALEAFIILDDEGKIVDANPSACALLALPKEALLGRDLVDFVVIARRDEDSHLWQALLKRGEHKGEFQVARADGQKRNVEYYAKTNFLPGYHLAAVRDITERKSLEEQLAYQAFHDALTGLPNRALFMDRLSQALARVDRRSDSVAVLFLDLDDFKVINDSLGHKVGDQLLVGVGERLKQCTRSWDTVARLGGDEFTILLEDITRPGDVIRVVERINEQLRTPFIVEGAELFANTSIGVAITATSQDQPDDLLRNADLAMYEAKAKGKAGYAAFDPSMNSRAWERLETETDLRRAIEREEFIVYYQPVVDLQTGKIIEVEALARWERPGHGVVSPANFIPLAEQTGLIVPIGQWVLQEACRQAGAWQVQLGEERPLILSVNMSARQLAQPRIADSIARVLAKTGLPAHCLKLEITESVALDSSGPTFTAFEELKALGLLLAIDDFGTGYSALSYLKRYPIDTLKLDRSFIDGLGEDAEDTAIVQAVVAFAKALNLSVIAEGIETAEQLAHLKSLGCDWGQGYYFSRPLPADQVSALFAHTYDTSISAERALEKSFA